MLPQQVSLHVLQTNSPNETPEKDAEAPSEPTADQLKELGNACVRDKKFEEAVLHYTHAIKLSPKDPILYSNRSLAFLKINQLYYAHEDAEKAIELDETWAKGYFRKAEVLFNAGQYDTALLSYAAALQRMPNDMMIIDAARKAAQYSNRETMYDKRVPWVGAGIGIVLGVIIVLLDQLVTKVPTVSVSDERKKTNQLPSLNLYLFSLCSIQPSWFFQ